MRARYGAGFVQQTGLAFCAGNYSRRLAKEQVGHCSQDLQAFVYQLFYKAKTATKQKYVLEHEHLRISFVEQNTSTT